MVMFKGVFTPIVTPFDEREQIDYGRMKHNLEKWGKTDLAGIVVLGTNGEFAYLTKDEKLELTEFAINHFTPGKKIIVGTGCETTRETIDLSARVADFGAHAVLVLPPYYYKGSMKDDILYQHYMEVADASPVPVMIYNMPRNTGINLAPSLVARLSKHPNIVGIKDTSGNISQLIELVRDTKDGFSVFAGNAGYLLPALSIGAAGGTLATANIFPDECCRLLSLFEAGRMKEAKELQLRLAEPNFLVTVKLGIPALKAALDMLGYQGGLPRRPLRPLTDDEKAVVRQALVRFGAIE
jgi:4-hydroxy-2-oxoglutarate aldolase